jgi:hypothetical protein
VQVVLVEVDVEVDPEVVQVALDLANIICTPTSR